MFFRKTGKAQEQKIPSFEEALGSLVKSQQPGDDAYTAAAIALLREIAPDGADSVVIDNTVAEELGKLLQRQVRMELNKNKPTDDLMQRAQKTMHEKQFQRDVESMLSILGRGYTPYQEPARMTQKLEGLTTRLAEYMASIATNDLSTAPADVSIFLVMSKFLGKVREAMPSPSLTTDKGADEDNGKLFAKNLENAMSTYDKIKKVAGGKLQESDANNAIRTSDIQAFIVDATRAACALMMPNGNDAQRQVVAKVLHKLLEAQLTGKSTSEQSSAFKTAITAALNNQDKGTAQETIRNLSKLANSLDEYSKVGLDSAAAPTFSAVAGLFRTTANDLRRQYPEEARPAVPTRRPPLLLVHFNTLRAQDELPVSGL